MSLPGEKLLTRMWVTVVEKGIGRLLAPGQMVRDAKARAEAMRVIAAAEMEIEEMQHGMRMLQSGSDSPGSVPALPTATVDNPPPLFPAVKPQRAESIVQQGVLAEAARREVNVAKTLLLAEELLESETEPPPDASPSDDWLYRWRDAAGEVSEPELQRLWAKVIAGEFKSPRRFSLRTIELIRNLSRDEAAAIEKLGPFLASEAIYRSDQTVLDNAGLQFGFLLWMQDLAILSGVEAIGLGMQMKSLRSDKFVQTLKSHGKVLVIEHDDASQVLSLPAYLVTRVGREILSLDKFEPNLEYLRSVGRDAVAKGFTVKLADFVNTGPDSIHYFNGVPIE